MQYRGRALTTLAYQHQAHGLCVSKAADCKASGITLSVQGKHRAEFSLELSEATRQDGIQEAAEGGRQGYI